VADITTKALATSLLPTIVLVFNEGVFEMADKLKQSQGNIVTGERFWDREKDLELFIEKIEEGAHILLVAQRRMGKTSLMAEAAERLRDRYVCLFVDLQGARSGPDAIKEITVKVREYMNLWQRTKDLFGNVLVDYVEEVNAGELGVKIRAGLSEATWTGKGDELFRILADSEKPVVIFMDEVPILVNYLIKGENGKITGEGKKRADQFMSWIRKNSIEHQKQVRIVISGSIGLEPVLRQAGLSATVNNFVPFELKAWDEETAKNCLSALANEYGIKFEQGATSKVTEKLGSCIPHHVQMFFGHIYDKCKRRGNMICTIRDVEEVYNSEMLGVRGHAELTHYEERLERVLGMEMSPFAFDMLTEAAVVGRLDKQAIAAFAKEYAQSVTNAAEAQKEILQVLEHDGYLKKVREGFVFESKLLRDWWKNRHEAFFTSVLKRRA
jgi:hypothetical protein